MIAFGPLKTFRFSETGESEGLNSSWHGELFDDQPYRNRRYEKASLERR